MAGNTLWQNLRNTFVQDNNAVAQIITINVAVFSLNMLLLIVLRFSQSSVALYDTIVNHLCLPGSFGQLIYQPYSLLTYAFMHAGVFHILFNMLGIYWFGQIVREYIGNFRVWPLFIFGSLAGALLFLACYNGIPYLHVAAQSTYLLGASAGVLALVVAAATLVPDNQLYLILIGPVSLKYLALFYILLDFAFIAMGDNIGGHIAHLGGAALGFVFIKQLQAGNDWSKGFSNFLANPRALFTKKQTKSNVVKMKVPPIAKKAASPTPTLSPQERLDQILDKISAKGYNALSDEEKAYLDNYSKNRT